MMQIKAFFADEDMSDEEKRALEDAGVDLDDWDCILICPPDSIELCDEYEYMDYLDGSKKLAQRWKPRSFYLEVLLERNSTYDCKWRKTIFQGEEVAIGVAYHG